MGRGNGECVGEARGWMFGEVLFRTLTKICGLLARTCVRKYFRKKNLLMIRIRIRSKRNGAMNEVKEDAETHTKSKQNAVIFV